MRPSTLQFIVQCTGRNIFEDRELTLRKKLYIFYHDMKLTIEDVAEMTGLTPATVREYARRMGVGRREGRRKYFTKSEARQIDSGELPKQTPKKTTSRNRSKSKKTAAR